MAGNDEIARLQAAVEELSARVAKLEAQRVPPPLQPAMETAKGALGFRTINRVGALTLAIGVIFFFKYAVDENLIGAALGVFLGVLLGAALLAGGEWLIRHEQRVFAQGVSGCGLAVIYISIYAALAFYRILLESAGFVFLAAVSALAVFLSLRYRNPAIAALGFIGALLTPILLHNASSEATLVFPYLLLVQLTAIFIAIRENWGILDPVVAPLVALAAGVMFEPKHPYWFFWFALSLSVVHFVAFFYAPGAGPTRNTLYVIGHSALLLAALRFLGLAIAEKSAVREVASVLLAVYGTALLAYGLARASAVNRILGLVLVGLVIAKLYLVDVWVLARIYRITAFVGLGALLLITSYIYSRSERRRSE